jgi:hypothetical protein
MDLVFRSNVKGTPPKRPGIKGICGGQVPDPKTARRTIHHFNGKNLNIYQVIVSDAIYAIVPAELDILPVYIPASIGGAIYKYPRLIRGGIDRRIRRSIMSVSGTIHIVKLGMLPGATIDAILDKYPGGIPVGRAHGQSPGIFPIDIKVYKCVV